MTNNGVNDTVGFQVSETEHYFDNIKLNSVTSFRMPATVYSLGIIVTFYFYIIL